MVTTVTEVELDIGSVLLVFHDILQAGLNCLVNTGDVERLSKFSLKLPVTAE